MAIFNWFIFLVASLCWFWLFGDVEIIFVGEKMHFSILFGFSLRVFFFFLAIHLASPLEMLRRELLLACQPGT